MVVFDCIWENKQSGWRDADFRRETGLRKWAGWALLYETLACLVII